MPVVIGDADAMRRGAQHRGLDPDAVRVIRDPREATNDPALIELVQTGPTLGDVPIGELSAEAGDGAYRFVVEACRLAGRASVDGIVTPPLNKAAMHAGGHNGPGTPNCSPTSSAWRTLASCSPPATYTSSTSPRTSRCDRPSTTSRPNAPTTC